MILASYNSKSSLLSEREIEIIQLIIEELSTKQIAGKLFLSNETIKSHRRNIMRKLDVKNVAGIVREAFCRRIIVFKEVEDLRIAV